jgi:hypothetical protein
MRILISVTIPPIKVGWSGRYPSNQFIVIELATKEVRWRSVCGFKWNWYLEEVHVDVEVEVEFETRFIQYADKVY